MSYTAKQLDGFQTARETNQIRRSMAREIVRLIPVTSEDIKTYQRLKANELSAQLATRGFIRSLVENKDKI